MVTFVMLAVFFVLLAAVMVWSVVVALRTTREDHASLMALLFIAATVCMVPVCVKLFDHAERLDGGSPKERQK